MADGEGGSVCDVIGSDPPTTKKISEMSVAELKDLLESENTAHNLRQKRIRALIDVLDPTAIPKRTKKAKTGEGAAV